MHENGAAARPAPDHPRTIGGDLRARPIGAHVTLDAMARGHRAQSHVVKLANDAFCARHVSAVSFEQDAYRPRHAQTGSMLGTAGQIL